MNIREMVFEVVTGEFKSRSSETWVLSRHGNVFEHWTHFDSPKDCAVRLIAGRVILSL